MIESVVAVIMTWIATFGMRVVGAAIILVAGIWVSTLLRKVVEGMLRKGKQDEALVSFLGSLTYVGLVAFVVIAALAKLNVATASFVAVLGAAGLAIGLALQGSLANFAAGVLMLIFKPIKVDEFVEAAGTAGIVEDIQIFTTQLRTPDNKVIIIPNAQLMGGNITNFTRKDTRRMDLMIGVSYGDDIEKVKQAIMDVLLSDERVQKDPAPVVRVFELADSSVNFAVRPWVRTPEYWDVYFDTMEAIKKRLDQEGISIPFPQRDVHMYQQPAA